MRIFNRDLLVALITTFVFIIGAGISFGIVSLHPVLIAYVLLATVLWIDHRLRGRHRLGWFWSTFWRVLVAGIAFNGLANAISGFGGPLVAIGVIALTAGGIWGGLWWASTYFEDIQEKIDLESAQDTFR